MSHHHFTLDERMFIQFAKESNKSHRQIAKELSVSHSAINYEVAKRSVSLEFTSTSRVNKPKILSVDLRTRRGRGLVPDKLAAGQRWRQRLERFSGGQPSYDARLAHDHYLSNRRRASQGNCKLVDGCELAQKIKTMLLSKERDSPEQIAANLAKEGVLVAPQTIYNWIARSRDRQQLVKGLRRRGKPYRFKKDSNVSWNKTKDKRSIHSRPVIIEQLGRYGDLEGDTIFGSDSKDRILTHVDRATGLVSLSRVLGYDASKIQKQTARDIARVFGSVHTITYDNGSEFSTWKLTERQLGATIYFADPYRSSQRGRNENVNGLVRDYFPKGTDFKQITDKELREVENILNKRSRKRYNWRSPFAQRDHLMSMA